MHAAPAAPEFAIAGDVKAVDLAGGALLAQDKALARVELWSREVLDTIDEPADWRLVHLSTKRWSL